MIVNYYPGGSVDKIGTPLRYTGSFFVKIDENNQDNWECHLLTSGTLTTEKSVDVDIFLVGGGGGGSGGPQYHSSSTYSYYGWGGAGGRTLTQRDCSLLRGVNYAATIGAGGTGGAYPDGQGGNGGNTAFVADNNSSINFEASGGGGGGPSFGSANKPVGGRSGGRGAEITWDDGQRYVRSASAGSPALDVVENFPNEYSQDEKVSAFWEDGATPYAGGGAGGGLIVGFESASQTGNLGGEGGGGASCHDGMVNTGGGGGGGDSDSVGRTAGNGGSGIIIIRNHRSAT